jgi:aspartate/tyrosine/aromatic aminotransferase
MAILQWRPGLVNLEMQRGRSSGVQSYRGEHLATAQKHQTETAFLFVINKLGFFAFVRLDRTQIVVMKFSARSALTRPATL